MKTGVLIETGAVPQHSLQYMAGFLPLGFSPNKIKSTFRTLEPNILVIGILKLINIKRGFAYFSFF
jgi:hypothetical protein